MNEHLASILVVDDEEDIRDGLSTLLKDSGYRVDVAAHGLDALEKIREDDFDLVITDIRMPVMDGMEFLEKIKTKKNKIKVIMMTAFGEIETYLEALNFGAIEYINKPIKFGELRRIISKVLEN